MSTAVSTHHHHHISMPIAAAAAVVGLVAGAAVLGVALSQDDTAPSAPPAPTQVNHNPPSRVGQGDFAQQKQSQQGPEHRRVFRSGDQMPGTP